MGFARRCFAYVAIPIPEMIQCYHLLIPSSFVLDKSLPMRGLLFLGFLFVGCCVLFCCFFVCFAVSHTMGL